MKARPIVKNLLLFFAVFSLGYLVGKEVGLSAASGPEADGTANAAVPARQLVVYYFHGAKRCATCNKIEAYGRETVEREFARELAARRIAWRVVNKDEPRHRHFVEDYGLTTSALVLVDLKDGQEEDAANLKRVWDLVDDKEAFQTYVREAVQTYLQVDEGEDEDGDGHGDEDGRPENG